jgi:hypothetical protein
MLLKLSGRMVCWVTNPNQRFLIVSRDDPALFGESHEIAQRGILQQIRHSVFARLWLALRPLDQQPFRLTETAQLVVAECQTNAHAREAGTPRAPGDCSPGSGRKASRSGRTTVVRLRQNAYPSSAARYHRRSRLRAGWPCASPQEQLSHGPLSASSLHGATATT